MADNYGKNPTDDLTQGCVSLMEETASRAKGAQHFYSKPRLGS
jgi:hypothetical protein